VLDPHAEYGRRLESHLQTIARRERQHILIGNLKLATIIAFLVLLGLRYGRQAISTRWLFAPVLAYAALAIVHEYTIRARTHAETAAALYRAGFARMEDRWSGTGATGERFRDPKHVYADDLDLFGNACLFQLLSTARLPMGENRLAEWLLRPSRVAAVVERQGLVEELREKLDLREDLAVTGEDLRVRLNPESLTRWCEGAPVVVGGGVLRLLAATCALCVAGTFAYLWSSDLVWPFLTALGIEAVIYVVFRARALSVVSGVSCNAEGVVLFSKIVERLEKERFASPRLEQLQAEFTRGGGEQASQALRRFARIVNWIDGRESLIAYILELPALYTFQTALAAEAWRKQHGHQMRMWVDVVGETEALLSLSAYAFEHPADPFPEIDTASSSPALFDGEELGHPLIPNSQCVRNSVCLDASTRVLLVSGSNMSGKSTLLRTVGINTVLAMAGAPIRGKALRMSPLSLGTRLRSIDSLQEGQSTFYTELLRIRQVFDLASGENAILFLFDELLDGTNSHDRRIGAENLVRAFLESGAIGIVTTHDLALAEMARSMGNTVRNAHFEDHVENGEMRFDYKLRDGVVTKSNALELMRLVGLRV
jgi:MutS domain V